MKTMAQMLIQLRGCINHHLVCEQRADHKHDSHRNITMLCLEMSVHVCVLQ